jgi:hypothetical protein
MKSEKAPGTDNVIPEVLKVDIKISVDMLHPLFEKIWQEEKVPKEWEGIIVKIPKMGIQKIAIIGGASHF